MHSAPEGFYFQASNGSVALPVAGYFYNSDRTPLLAGLSPAGMAASLAAPDPRVAPTLQKGSHASRAAEEAIFRNWISVVRPSGAARSIPRLTSWLRETGLRGWACEIRTQKCRRKLSV
jgi:hypothetical protein